MELGYTANEAQLWSVIPYAVDSVVTVIVSIISDRLKLRGVVMLFVLLPAIIGYAVIANISVAHPKVKYGMTFLMATGMYASVPCVLVWNSNNSAGHYKRATTTALQLAIANMQLGTCQPGSSCALPGRWMTGGRLLEVSRNKQHVCGLEIGWSRYARAVTIHTDAACASCRKGFTEHRFSAPKPSCSLEPARVQRRRARETVAARWTKTTLVQ